MLEPVDLHVTSLHCYCCFCIISLVEKTELHVLNVVILFIHMHALQYVSNAGLFFPANVGEMLMITWLATQSGALNKSV